MGGEWTAHFNESDGATTVRLEAAMIPSGWLKVMSPVIGSFARKAITKDTQAFKAWVEDGGERSWLLQCPAARQR